MKDETVHIDVGFELRVLIYPAGDIKDVWIAHALDFDLVTQSESQEAALSMLESAMDDLVEYRILTGLVPVEYRSAPPEVWDLADLAVGEKLPRTPVTAWVSSRKAVSHGSRRAATDAPINKPKTYVSKHPPMLHASAV